MRQLAPVDSATDAGLDRLIEAWPKLPDPMRAGILAMVKAAASG